MLGEEMRTRPAIEYIGGRLGKQLIGVEIGVLEGGNAAYILNTLDILWLFLIDLWGSYQLMNGPKEITVNKEKCYDRVKGRFKDDSRVEVIKGDSIEESKSFADLSLDFVYIDGNHNYEAVLDDIAVWILKVKKGGVLAGHDYDCKEFGVKRAVDEWFDSEVQAAGCDWWVQL